MGACTCTPEEDDQLKHLARLATITSLPRAADSKDDHLVQRRETHFFVKQQMAQGYSYDDLCLTLPSTSTMISETDTEVFVTPKSYRRASYGSYLKQQLADMKQGK